MLLSAGAFTAAGAQSPGASAKFVLNGDVAKIKEPIEWVYLYYNVGTQRISDSVLVKGGKYSFTGNVPEPTQAGLRVKYQQAGRRCQSRAYSTAKGIIPCCLSSRAISVWLRLIPFPI